MLLCAYECGRKRDQRDTRAVHDSVERGLRIERRACTISVQDKRACDSWTSSSSNRGEVWRDIERSGW